MPTSLPAGVFTRASLGDESLELLRSLPLTMLYCGFVKYEVEGTEGVWMRTYGADRFGLPDFAALAEGHHQGEFCSNIFNNIMAYLLQSGAEMDAGHTMQIGENAYLKLREARQASTSCKGRAARWSRRSSPRTRSTGRTPERDRARPAAPAGRARVLSPPDDFRMDTDGTDPARQAAQALEREAQDAKRTLHAHLVRKLETSRLRSTRSTSPPACQPAAPDGVSGPRARRARAVLEVTPTPTGGSSSPSTSPIRWHGAWCRNWASC